MASLTFQFSRPDLDSEYFKDKVVSEGIMKLTRSEICHVDFVTPEGTLIGAHINGGVQERPANYETWGLRIRVTILVPGWMAAKALEFARSKLGTKYDCEDILGIAIADANLHNSADLICSCLGSEIVDNKELRIVRVAKDHWQVSPEELRMVLTSQPGAVEERILGK